MAQNRIENPWVVHRKPRPQARLRLFCFPYAGGGGMVYRDWTTAMPEEIDVVPVLLPGRERRLAEKPFRRMGPLVDALERSLASYFDLPYAVFGHSMGAAIGFELAQRLRRRGLEPVHLLVSARAAPQLPREKEPCHGMSDHDLRDRLRQLGGTPPEVLAHPDLMELLLPAIRADFEVHETYGEVRYPPLGCPVSAFGGTADGEVTQQEIEAWREVTSGRFELKMFSGDHFFLQGRKELISAVATALLDRPLNSGDR